MMEKKRSRALFGPGGNSDDFYRAGYRQTKESPKFLSEIGLDAYEFEAGNGLRVSDATLTEIASAAKEYGIAMSLHAPYYISLSGTDPEKRLKSIDYIEQSLHAASVLSASTIVVHTGSAAKISREEAMNLAKDTLTRTLERLDTHGVLIGLETMGKQNQLGTLDEVIELCTLDPRLVPVVDFGHMNARACGGVFETVDAYRYVFDRIGERLGDDVARYLHCHFSKIEWTAAGEKKHLTFDDTVYGPMPDLLAECLVRESLYPTVICESDGTMSRDALMMKKEYERIQSTWKN